MSKEILVDPEIVQVKRKIELGDILVNSFDKTIAESLSIIEKSKAIKIYYRGIWHPGADWHHHLQFQNQKLILN